MTGILESCDRLLFNSDHKRQIYDDRNFTQYVTMEKLPSRRKRKWYEIHL